MKLSRMSVPFIALPALLAASVPSVVDGAFALQTGAPKTAAYLRETAAAHGSRERHLDLWFTPSGKTAPLTQYAVDMTKLLHLIVISDDFEHFEHVHPVLGSDGHFKIDDTFPGAGPTHVFADASPAGIGQQVFRFDVQSGGRAAKRSIVPTGTRVQAGPYTVTFSSVTLRAGSSTPLTVHVTRGTKPAKDLHPYLGALAHVVAIDTHDLTYVHVHPMPLSAGSTGSMDSMAGMDMSDRSMSETAPLPDGASSSPDMRLHLELREAGVYKVWFQFRGGSNLYVAPFIVKAT